MRPSNSEYASSIVLRRRCGEIHICIDFRILNKIMSRDNYPLPLIENQLDKLRGKQYFSKLLKRTAIYHDSQLDKVYIIYNAIEAIRVYEDVVWKNRAPKIPAIYY